MAAEVVKRWKNLRQKKEKAQVQIEEKREEQKKTALQIKEMKAQRAACLKERKEAESRALQNEKDLAALKMEILAVQKEVSICEIELEELNWEYSRVFFSGVKRRKISEQIKEKKAQNASRQEKLKELKKKRDGQEQQPRYLETIEQHTKIRKDIGRKSDEMQAHLELVKRQQETLQKELSGLEEELAPIEEQIAQMLESGELTEEERDRLLAEEEPEEPEKPDENAIAEAQEEEDAEKEGRSVRNVRRPGEPKLSVRNVGKPGSKQPKGPLYAPGEEPEGLQELLREVMEKLEEVYPDRVVIGLHADHKRLGKKVTELYRLLQYENGNEFLKAYGFTVKRKRPWG